MKSLKWSVLICVLMAGVLILSACGGTAPQPTPAPTEPPPPAETPTPPAATPEPTPTSEASPPGTEDNPLIFAATDVSGFNVHQVVCGLLAEETGLTIESPAFASDQELVGYLASGGTPHVVISFPPGYLVAHEKYGYEVAVLGTQLGGQQSYTVQIIAGAGTGIASLADAAGRCFCWGNPNFLTGNQIPRLMLRAEGLDPETDLGEATTLLTQVLVSAAVYNGDCELGTVAEGVIALLERQHADATTRVLVVAESPPIPSMSLSFAPGLPDDVQTAVVEGLRAVLAREDGAQALQMGYGWESVDEVDDSLYDPLRELIRDARGEADDLL